MSKQMPKPPSGPDWYQVMLILAILFLVFMAIFSLAGWWGCAATTDLEARFGTMETTLGTLQSRIGTVEVAVGGDINEPITGWMLAGGSTLITLALITAYTVMHRSKLFRTAKARVRGKGC